MAELAVETKSQDFQLEKVQDYTPTPMTVSTETWYAGVHPYTGEEVISAKTQREKLRQRMYFFWYKPEERRPITESLTAMGRRDLLERLYGNAEGRASRQGASQKRGKPTNKNKRRR